MCEISRLWFLFANMSAALTAFLPVYAPFGDWLLQLRMDYPFCVAIAYLGSLLTSYCSEAFHDYITPSLYIDLIYEFYSAVLGVNNGLYRREITHYKISNV